MQPFRTEGVGFGRRSFVSFKFFNMSGDPAFSEGATTMRKYLLAAVLVAAFAAPALAEEFYVAFDGKRCEMFSHKPPQSLKLLGTFSSKHDAEKAMEKMKQCKKG
jgi:hypothetical protein